MAEEKLFENQVKRWLESEGIYDAGTPQQDKIVPECGWFYKTWGGGMQKSGLPDLILNVNGIFIGCELKSKSGKPSELQKKNVVAINASNGLGLVLYPNGFEQLKTIVKGVKQCKYHIPVLNALKAANSSTACAILTSY